MTFLYNLFFTPVGVSALMMGGLILYVVVGCRLSERHRETKDERKRHRELFPEQYERA